MIIYKRNTIPANIESLTRIFNLQNVGVKKSWRWQYILKPTEREAR